MYHGCRETLERDPQDLEDPQVLQDRQDRDLCVNHSVTFWIKLPDQSLFDWLIFISDICGYGRFRILRFGICAGEKGELWGLLRTSSSSRSTCALCYIFSFIVEGTTWSAWSIRATRSSWPTWSSFSRLRSGFWGTLPTRTWWHTWPACKCWQFNLQSLNFSRQSRFQCSLWWRTSEWGLLDCRVCPVHQELMVYQERRVPKEKR